MDKDILNASGYIDVTAYEAMKNIRREERKKLIDELNATAHKYGYVITSRITLKDIKDDK